MKFKFEDIISPVKDIVKNYFEEKEEQEKLNFKRNNDMHKELEWRNKVYSLEIQDTYTVKDLVILNSFINPYEHGDKLDTYINQVITNILDELINGKVSFENETNRDDVIKDVIGEKVNVDEEKTLFDFPIDSGLLKKLLSSEQSAKVRECAHLLLKNDWKKQVK